MSDDLTTPTELTQRVLRIIAGNQKKDISLVTVDSSFEELGIDSMDAVNIVFEIENAFDIHVPDEEMKNIRSVRDIVEGVHKLLPAQPPDWPGEGRRLMQRAVVTGIGVICCDRAHLAGIRGSIAAGPRWLPRQSLTRRGPWDLRFHQRGAGSRLRRDRLFRAERSRHAGPVRTVRCNRGTRGVKQSGIEWTTELRETTAIVTGSCIGGQTTEDQGFVDLYKTRAPASSSHDDSEDDGECRAPAAFPWSLE